MLTHFSSVIMRVRDLDVGKKASVGQSGEGREPSQSCPGRGEGGAPNTAHGQTRSSNLKVLSVPLGPGRGQKPGDTAQLRGANTQLHVRSL